MIMYNYGTQEVVVSQDTVVVPREHFEILLMEHAASWRRHLAEGVFGETEETARNILKQIDDVYYELLKESNAMREAKRAQLDIPF